MNVLLLTTCFYGFSYSKKLVLLYFCRPQFPLFNTSCENRQSVNPIWYTSCPSPAGTIGYELIISALCSFEYLNKAEHKHSKTGILQWFHTHTPRDKWMIMKGHITLLIPLAETNLNQLMKQLSSHVMEIAKNECVTCVTSLKFLYWCGVQCVTVTYLSRGRPLYVKDQ